MKIFKRILAVLAGLVVGNIIVFAGDYCSGQIAHVPAGIDPMNKQAISDLMAHMPVSAFLVMLLGYAAGAFAGGLVSTLISAKETSRPAIIVGIIMTIGGVMNQFMLPHPLWFTIVSTLIYIPFAWFGYGVLKPKASANIS